MKRKRMISYTIVSVFIMLAVIFYISHYQTTMDTLEKDLKDYLKLENISIVEMERIPKRDAYKMILFTSEKGVHVAVLNQGVNGKYQIRRAYTTEEELSFFDYNFSGYEYFILYGNFEDTVTSVNLLYKDDHNKIIEYPNKPFILYSPTTAYNVTYDYPSGYRLHYQDGSKALIRLEKQSYNINTKTSGSKLMVESLTILIALLGVLLLIPLHLFTRGKGKYTRFGKVIKMENDDMVRSQMRF